MKCWFLPNFSVQIAPDCFLEYLNFQNFQGGACPLVSLAAVFSIVTQKQQGALRDDTKNGCEGDYMPPGPSSFLSRLGRHSSLALSSQYFTYSQLCPTKVKNRLRPCHFAAVWFVELLEWPEATEDAYLHAQPAADCPLNKVFKVPP